MVAKYSGINFLIFILFIADRVFKNYFLQNPPALSGGDFIFGLVSFHLEKNPGIAFGILINQILLIGLVSVVILVLVHFLIKAYLKSRLIEVAALSLISAGAFSNIFDRLLYGYVIDYIDLRWFTVFNLADVMITAGVIIISLNILWGDRLDKK